MVFSGRRICLRRTSGELSKHCGRNTRFMDKVLGFNSSSTSGSSDAGTHCSAFQTLDFHVCRVEAITDHQAWSVAQNPFNSSQQVTLMLPISEVIPSVVRVIARSAQGHSAPVCRGLLPQPSATLLVTHGLCSSQPLSPY